MIALPATSGPLYAVAFSRDGLLLAAGGLRGELQLWAGDGTSPLTLTGYPAAGPGISSLAFTPTGVLLAAGSGPIGRWGVTERKFRNLDATIKNVGRIALSPDGGFLACQCWDDRHRLQLRRGDGAVRWEVGVSLAGVVRSLAFSADGQSVLAGNDGGLVRQWNTANAQVRRTWAGPPEPVYAVAAAPDGRSIAWITDEYLCAADADGPAVRRLAHAPPRPFTALAFDPTGRLLLTGGRDGLARYWDVTTGREITAFDWRTGPLWGVAFSPDGLRAACCSQGGTVVIWDVDQ